MKQKLPLLFILLIGILTPLASTALYYGWRPTAQTNQGEILPPHPITATAANWRRTDGTPFTAREWRGDWVLAVPADGDCDQNCRRRLCQIRQIRLMLPGNYLRLRRVWLITDATSPPTILTQKTDCGEAPHLRARTADILSGVETLHIHPKDLPPSPPSPPQTPQTPHIYLIDPAGIWAMRFPPAMGAYQIQKDLKRLLRISKGRKTSPSPDPLNLLAPATAR